MNCAFCWVVVNLINLVFAERFLKSFINHKLMCLVKLAQVWRILKLENIGDPANNYEVVAGTGERCVPGSEDRSVDIRDTFRSTVRDITQSVSDSN